MRHANFRDRFIVDKVEVVTGIQNPRDERGAQSSRQRLIESDVSQREARPRIVGRKIERAIGDWTRLPQKKADAMKVSRDIRHRDPPGITFAEYRRRVKAPAWFTRFRRGIGPAVPDQLINPL